MGEKDNVPISEEEKESDKLRVSRRDFLKGIGTGTVAAAMITTPGLKSEAEAAPPKGIREAVIQTEINGRRYRFAVKTNWTLLEVLRKELGLTGTKKSCDRGSCGACTVIMDGRAIYACALLAVEADKRRITTIEGLSDGEKLHPIQAAFAREDALQCGFCTPAQILSTKALLDKNPRPSEYEVKEALSGTICRCAAYPKIVKAVMSVREKA
ncbi:MAG TPA: (2Fe-2S)-binding protein [Syntrophorhabdales bacterium]|nr:(2Fe-2S)-binding protein [Syntrophorhabdales bacterium]